MDPDFDHALARATASPRSKDISKSPSNIVRLVSSTERPDVSVSSASSGGGSDVKLCVASIDWTNMKNAVVSLLDYVYMCWRLVARCVRVRYRVRGATMEMGQAGDVCSQRHEVQKRSTFHGEPEHAVYCRQE